MRVPDPGAPGPRGGAHGDVGGRGGAAAGGGVSGAFRGGRASADVRVHRTSSDEAKTPSEAAEPARAPQSGASGIGSERAKVASVAEGIPREPGSPVVGVPVAEFMK